MQVAPLLGEQPVDARPLELVLARAHQPGRLVQRHVKFALGPHRVPVHRHLVVHGVNPRAQFRHGLAVDRYPPGQNDLFTRAPRGNACLGQELLQTNHLSAERRVRNGEPAEPAEKPPCGLRPAALRTPHSALAQTSFLVLRRPVIRSPSFHWPRRLSTSTRSNRLSTFRLPPKVAAARRLRCCDINKNPVPVCQRLLRSTWKRELFVTRRPALANG